MPYLSGSLAPSAILELDVLISFHTRLALGTAYTASNRSNRPVYERTSGTLGKPYAGCSSFSRSSLRQCRTEWYNFTLLL